MRPIIPYPGGLLRELSELIYVNHHLKNVLIKSDFENDSQEISRRREYEID